MRRIAQYEVIEKLGKGGMGHILRVRDPISQLECALKWTNPVLSRNHLVTEDRFLHEIEILRELNHPCIPPLIGSGKQGGMLYYTMPIIDGVTLRSLLQEAKQYLKKGRQVPREASLENLIPLFVRGCQANAYANEQGILHRDLKGDNLMVSKASELYIIDWGIAQRIGDQETVAMTAGDELAAYVANVAPERADGGVATIASEIYAFGVVLYEMLTLRAPFQRQNFDRYRRIREGEYLIAPHKRTKGREVPASLEQVCLKALSYDPNERYACFHDFEAAVSAAYTA